jgi:hypothetical protein
MLEAELVGEPYVKAGRIAALMERIGRTHRSVEFKHQNVSAVLDELGMQWIPGLQAQAQLSGRDIRCDRPLFVGSRPGVSTNTPAGVSGGAGSGARPVMERAGTGPVAAP